MHFTYRGFTIKPVTYENKKLHQATKNNIRIRSHDFRLLANKIDWYLLCTQKDYETKDLTVDVSVELNDEGEKTITYTFET